ncbi:MAG: hypothetical protein HY075_06290 [Deltaproteobacteria bacterium]|nr:hypothetical protein [Deltaproteobacteria bacterium]
MNLGKIFLVLSVVSLATGGCASRRPASEPLEYVRYEKQAAAISCPGSSVSYAWCGDLKSQLEQLSRQVHDGSEEALESYKRSLGQLLVAVSFSEIAHARNEVLLHRPVNSDAYVHMAEGAPTKGMHIKGKSSDWGPHRGFIPVHERYSKLAHVADSKDRELKIAKYDEKNRESIEKGYAIPVPLKGPHGTAVVRGGQALWTSDVKAGDEVIEVLGDPKTGGYITADVDMLAFGKHGPAGEMLSDPDQGDITTGEVETAADLNEAFRRHGYMGGRIVQHGAEDRFRLSDGVDYPVTAFEPDGKMIVIQESPGKDKDRDLRRYFRAQKRKGFELYVNPNWHWKQ